MSHAPSRTAAKRSLEMGSPAQEVHARPYSAGRAPGSDTSITGYHPAS